MAAAAQECASPNSGVFSGTRVGTPTTVAMLQLWQSSSTWTVVCLSSVARAAMNALEPWLGTLIRRPAALDSVRPAALDSVWVGRFEI